MSNKLHFAIVPDSLIAKRRPEELQIYCELYMLEVSNQRYTLKLICADRNWKYTTAYRLLRLARETLGTSRQKSRASNQKRKRNENKKNNLDTPRTVDNRVSNAKTEHKETQTDTKTEQTNTNNKKGRPDSPQSVDVVAPLQLELESESITNDLTSGEKEIRIGSVQGCAPIPEPTSSLLTYESFCKLSINAQSNYIGIYGERWTDK
tara:strand:+ start:37 stop:657 length:621 start_codon:yes stop_codon:yes gene_type:complete